LSVRFEDWDPDEKLSESAYEAIRILFERYPEWLAQSDPQIGIVVRLKSEVPGVDDIVLWAEDATLSWGAWHAHYDYYEPAEIVEELLRTIDEIQSERWARCVEYDADGRWQSSQILESNEIAETQPGVHAMLITSWRGSFNRRIELASPTEGA